MRDFAFQAGTCDPLTCVDVLTRSADVEANCEAARRSLVQRGASAWPSVAGETTRLEGIVLARWEEMEPRVETCQQGPPEVRCLNPPAEVHTLLQYLRFLSEGGRSGRDRLPGLDVAWSNEIVRTMRANEAARVRCAPPSSGPLTEGPEAFFARNRCTTEVLREEQLAALGDLYRERMATPVLAPVRTDAQIDPHAQAMIFAMQRAERVLALRARTRAQVEEALNQHAVATGHFREIRPRLSDAARANIEARLAVIGDRASIESEALERRTQRAYELDNLLGRICESFSLLRENRARMARDDRVTRLSGIGDRAERETLRSREQMYQREIADGNRQRAALGAGPVRASQCPVAPP